MFHLREIQVDKAKVNIIQSFYPIDMREFCSFLGYVGFY
jgi:hypothetical protein